MIRLHIPGFYDSDKGGPRWGDAQIFTDANNCVIIDGYCGIGADRLIKILKDRGLNEVYLYISHAHYDHDYGIYRILQNDYFKVLGLGCYDPESLSGGFSNSEIKSDYNYLKKIINYAKSKKVPVIYLKHGDHVVHGDISFYVYRKQPSYTGNSNDPHGWAFVNDGSLCFWFDKLKYWTSGDGPETIYDMCKSVGAKPKFFKIPHHGNNCPADQAQGMKSRGAIYCWDNDYSTSITSFLKYGRRRCIEAKIKYFDVHGDINVIFYSKRAVIYKDGNYYRYSCNYEGKATLKNATAAITRLVLRGTAGNNDDRASYLLNRFYNPGLVQKSVNKVIEYANGIKDGKMDYLGKNEVRIANIDKELGTGYGQLVQDYINVLYKIRDKV